MSDYRHQCFGWFRDQNLDAGEFDMHFKCSDNKVIHAHQLVMRARSPMIDANLKPEWDENGDGVIQVKYASGAMLTFLTYCYTGIGYGGEDEWEVLVEMANFFMVDEAKKLYESKALSWCTDWKHAVKFVDMAHKCNLEELKKKCHRFIFVFSHAIAGSGDILCLDDDIAREIMKDGSTRYSAKQLFEFAFDWSCKKVMDEAGGGNYRSEHLVEIFRVQYASIAVSLPAFEIGENAIKYACSHAPFFTQYKVSQCFEALSISNDF